MNATLRSWIVELVGGSILGVAGTAVTRDALHLIPAAALALAGSVYYELKLDRNGWSWDDVGQRTVGIAIGLLIGGLIYG